MQDLPLLLAESKKALINGNDAEALKLAEKVLQQDPNSYAALMIAGSAEEQLNNLKTAVAFYERALQLQPGIEAGLRLRESNKRRLRAEGKTHDEIVNEFTEKETEVYERLLAPFKGRKIRLKIDSKPSKNSDPTKIYFGGAPYAEAGDSWPECEVCMRPRNFVGQLRWDSSVNDYTKEDFTTKWLFTLFCCFDCVRRRAPDSAFVRSYGDPAASKYVAIQPSSEPALEALERYDVTHDQPYITAPTKQELEKMRNRPDLDCIPLPYMMLHYDDRIDEDEKESATIGGLMPKAAGKQILVASLDLPVRFQILCSVKSPENCSATAK